MAEPTPESHEGYGWDGLEQHWTPVPAATHDELRAAAIAVGRSVELARVVNVLEDLRDNDMTSGCMEACFDRAIAAIT